MRRAAATSEASGAHETTGDASGLDSADAEPANPTEKLDATSKAPTASRPRRDRASIDAGGTNRSDKPRLNGRPAMRDTPTVITMIKAEA
jgi:hypothetical protein